MMHLPVVVCRDTRRVHQEVLSYQGMGLSSTDFEFDRPAYADQRDRG